MRAGTLLVVVPGAAVAVVAFALFGPGRALPVVAGQLLGGPFEGARVLSFRVSVVERFRGVDAPIDAGELEIETRSATGETHTAVAKTSRDGIAEVAVPLDRPATGSVSVVVRRAGLPTPIVSGELGASPERWGKLAPRPRAMRGAPTGDLFVRLAAVRGQFAAPFRDEAAVEVTRGGLPVAGAKLALSAAGAELDAGDHALGQSKVDVTTNHEGRATVFVRPLVHDVELDVTASAGGQEGRWNGLLPVIPGAIWLEPAPGARARVISPVVREAAYLTVACGDARVYGQTVTLARDGAGFASGEIDWSRVALPASATRCYATLASDPRGTGGGTVGWPVRADADPFVGDARAIPDVVLADGMPEVERRDQSRIGRARLLAGAALVATALLEGLLLSIAAGTGKSELDDALAEADRDAPKPSALAPALRLAMAIAVVVFALATLGVVTMWKTGS